MKSMIQLHIQMIQNQTSFSSMKERDIRASYEGFQSERHETTHSMHQNPDSYELRGLIRQFHVKYPVQALLTHFKSIFNEKGFKTTEVFPGKIMIVKLSFMDRIKHILSSKYPCTDHRQPCRYLLSVKTQQYKSVRKVSIRKLRDHPNIQYDNDFEQIRQLLNWIDENPVPLQLLSKNDQNSDNDFETSSQYQQDMYSLQATSTYMYHKIFVDRNYSMGRKMNKLVANSKEQLHQNSNKQAHIIIGGLNQITADMLKSFNCTRKELLQILCHCRKSVEDYYHDRKFLLKSKDKIEYQRSSIQTQIGQKIPQTIKCFYRMLQQPNSQKILLQIYKTNYIFHIQCQINGISESQRIGLAKKLGSIFSKQIHIKTRTLDLWGYQNTLYHQYLHDFIS